MPPFAQDPCWRPAVFRRAPSAPARSVRVSHDSDPASGHEPCPKPNPNPNPNPNPKAFRDIRTIEPVPTGGPAWPQQRKGSVRVGHPVERYGQRALFNLAPKPKTNSSPPANLCSRSRPPSRPAAPAAPLLLSSRSPAPPPIKTAAESMIGDESEAWTQDASCSPILLGGRSARWAMARRGRLPGAQPGHRGAQPIAALPGDRCQGQ